MKKAYYFISMLLVLASVLVFAKDHPIKKFPDGSLLELRIDGEPYDPGMEVIAGDTRFQARWDLFRLSYESEVAWVSLHIDATDCFEGYFNKIKLAGEWTEWVVNFQNSGRYKGSISDYVRKQGRTVSGIAWFIEVKEDLSSNLTEYPAIEPPAGGLLELRINGIPYKKGIKVFAGEIRFQARWDLSKPAGKPEDTRVNLGAYTTDYSKELKRSGKCEWTEWVVNFYAPGVYKGDISDYGGQWGRKVSGITWFIKVEENPFNGR